MSHPLVQGDLFANRISNAVLSAYGALNDKGKPKGNGEEWTVLAAFVAHFRKDDTLQVLSIGIGNKCIGVDAMRSDGTVINDSHAEVIARRAFLLYIYDELRRLMAGERQEGILQQCGTIGGKYRLATDVTLHMYVSESPCGDASIYEYMDQDQLVLNRTGAKVLRKPDDCGNVTDLGDTVGQLRTKSGRSDLPKGKRTTSMSCTDKIAKWCVLGLQGALLSQWVAPIFLSTIAISFSGTGCCHANVRSAMQRSLLAAFDETDTSKISPTVAISSTEFQSARRQCQPVALCAHELPKQESLKAEVVGNSTILLERVSSSQSRKRKAASMASASGLSMNWFYFPAAQSSGTKCHDFTEVTLSALGYKQGYTISSNGKGKGSKTRPGHQSRLSRASLLNLFLDTRQRCQQQQKVGTETPALTYTEWKHTNIVYQDAKQCFLKNMRFAAWGEKKCSAFRLLRIKSR